jgi:hypothetical protein
MFDRINGLGRAEAGDRFVQCLDAKVGLQRVGAPPGQHLAGMPVHEVRERAVRLVLDNQRRHESRWSALLWIPSKTGCSPQTHYEWVKKAEVDRGERTGIAS